MWKIVWFTPCQHGNGANLSISTLCVCVKPLNKSKNILHIHTRSIAGAVGSESTLLRNSPQGSSVGGTRLGYQSKRQKAFATPSFMAANIDHIVKSLLAYNVPKAGP